MNKAPIHWYIKKQPSIETSSFGTKLCAIKVGVEMVKALRYKLRIFGVKLDGAANVFYDNEAVYKSTFISKFTIRKNRYPIEYY